MYEIQMLGTCFQVSLLKIADRLLGSIEFNFDDVAHVNVGFIALPKI